MVGPFSPQVLAYLQAVHDAPRPVGPTVLDGLPGVVRERTVYRWQRSLGSRLAYFPSVSLSALGLVHAHVFLDGASERWVALPVVLAAAWVNHGLERPGLYLHCAIPTGAGVAFEQVVRSLVGDGWADASTIVFAGDGWQSLGRLVECLDGHGRIRAQRAPVEALRDGFFRASTEQQGLLRSYPFVVPAVFEAVEERCSLQEVWRRAYERLGPLVWRFFPRGTRRWPVNGKRYVRHAHELLVGAGLFRQNIIRYQPLLDHGLEAFVILPASAGPLGELVGLFGRVCPVVEVAPGHDGRVVLRLVGGDEAVYEVLRVAREVARPLSVWVLDARRPDALSGRVRFAYERLFDPSTGVWRFPAAEILGGLRGAS